MAAFDTHKAVKALRSAGFDNTQAEAVVDQINGAIHENVATKTDIEKLELRLAAELEKQSSKYLRSMVVVVAGIVGLAKALELLLV